MLKLDGDIQKLAAELKDSNSLLLFGRGYNHATALEAALKVCPPSLTDRVLWLWCWFYASSKAVQFTLL